MGMLDSGRITGAITGAVAGGMQGGPWGALAGAGMGYMGGKEAQDALGGLLDTGDWSPGITAPPGMRHAGDTSDYEGRVAAQETGAQQYQQALNQWLQGRNPYYQQMQNQYQASMQPGLQDQYSKALLGNKYAQANRGMMGSSVDVNAQLGAGSEYAAQLGQVQAQGAAAARAQQESDRAAAEQWYALYQSNPAMQVAHQAELDASRARAGMSGSLAAGAAQAGGVAAQGQQIFSGLLGQSLTGLGGTISGLGANGAFNSTPATAGGPPAAAPGK